MSYNGLNFKFPARRKTSKTRKRVVVPGLSMSIQTIVEKFMRDQPVNVARRQPVYSDQSEFDLEKISRMDFGEKKEFADQMAERASRLQNELTERKRAEQEAKARKAQAAAEKAAAKKKEGKSPDDSSRPLA